MLFIVGVCCLFGLLSFLVLVPIIYAIVIELDVLIRKNGIHEHCSQPYAFKCTLTSCTLISAVTGDERHCKIYLKHSEKAVEIASNVHFINTAAINKKLFIEQLDQSCDSFFVATLSVRHYDV